MDPLGGSGGRGSETAKKFNVALTRGKALNVVVGNPLILEQDRHWRRLIEFTAERRSYRGCRCAASRGTDLCDEVRQPPPCLSPEPRPLHNSLGSTAHPPAAWSQGDENEDDDEALISRVSKVGLGSAYIGQGDQDPEQLDSYFRDEVAWRVAL